MTKLVKITETDVYNVPSIFLLLIEHKCNIQYLDSSHEIIFQMEELKQSYQSPIVFYSVIDNYITNKA